MKVSSYSQSKALLAPSFFVLSAISESLVIDHVDERANHSRLVYGRRGRERERGGRGRRDGGGKWDRGGIEGVWEGGWGGDGEGWRIGRDRG